MKKLIFLCLSTAIVILSVIVLNLAPHIKNDITTFDYDFACQKFGDIYEYTKDKKPNEIVDYFGSSSSLSFTKEEEKEEYREFLKEGKNKCNRDKAMIGLEYAAFNINVVFGATCSLLGLLFYLGTPNTKGKVVGLIGMLTGVIGFILTLVYIIETGIITNSDIYKKTYQNSYSSKYSNCQKKIDSDGALLKWDSGKQSYVCIYYDEKKKDSLYVKFTDLKNKYYNYLTDFDNADEEKNWEYGAIGCQLLRLTPSLTTSLITWENCKRLDKKEIQISQIKYYDGDGKELGDCDKIYIPSTSTSSNFQNINTYNKVITAYIFSVFIVVFHIGLAIFGFLLFNDSGDSSSGPVSIK